MSNSVKKTYKKEDYVKQFEDETAKKVENLLESISKRISNCLENKQKLPIRIYLEKEDYHFFYCRWDKMVGELLKTFHGFDFRYAEVGHGDIFILESKPISRDSGGWRKIAGDPPMTKSLESLGINDSYPLNPNIKDSNNKAWDLNKEND